MRKQTDWLSPLFHRDSLAFPSEWSAESASRQKWLAAPSVSERSRPMLATAEKGPLLRRPRAAATIGDRLREAQLQTRAASVDILWRGMVKYPCQSLPERMQAECQWRTGSWGFLIAFRLSSLTGQGSKRAQILKRVQSIKTREQAENTWPRCRENSANIEPFGIRRTTLKLGLRSGLPISRFDGRDRCS